ncbi:CsbD family protein [Nocardia sp. NPDC051570]|uniref:CsbD family protein n=1 Tax=Nocardia sp. NPDC051570 TaxID=3364324 RepID=UPI0037907F93
MTITARVASCHCAHPERVRLSNRRYAMSVNDKISAKAEEVGGKAKEAAGNLTGDDDLRTEGRADQAEALMKNAVTDVKDTLGTAVDKARNLFDRK